MNMPQTTHSSAKDSDKFGYGRRAGSEGRSTDDDGA